MMFRATVSSDSSCSHEAIRNPMTLATTFSLAKSSSRVFVFALFFSCLLCTPVGRADDAVVLATTEPSTSDAAILQSFAATHDGFSSDELIITDRLREKFFDDLFQGHTATAAQQRDSLLRLLQLRKSGKLKTRATKRGPSVDSSVSPIAEIAARVVADRHRVSMDSILVDPNLRVELQQEANRISPDVDAYAVRKSLLKLRKTRHLRPELVLRVADWDREIRTYSIKAIRDEMAARNLPHQPGVYLFRNDEGYLYIGEASDLSARLQQHLTESDRVSLAAYLASDQADKVSVELHIFPKDSPASKLTVRRAYESELIRSRNPKFNARP